MMQESGKTSNASGCSSGTYSMTEFTTRGTVRNPGFLNSKNFPGFPRTPQDF